MYRRDAAPLAPNRCTAPSACVKSTDWSSTARVSPPRAPGTASKRVTTWLLQSSTDETTDEATDPKTDDT